MNVTTHRKAVFSTALALILTSGASMGQDKSDETIQFNAFPDTPDKEYITVAPSDTLSVEAAAACTYYSNVLIFDDNQHLIARKNNGA